MSAPTPQNASEHGQVPAMALDFNDATYHSEAHRYPQALPAEGIPVAAALPAPKKLGQEDAEAPRYPTAVQAPPRPRDFSSNLCDLQESWAIFADAFCCSTCIASGHHNLLVNDQEGLYAPMCCALFCVNVGLATISPHLAQALTIHTCYMRHTLRQRYNLHTTDAAQAEAESGNTDVKCNSEFLLDCVTVFFCLSCVLAQHQREILRQGEWSGGVFSDRHALEVPTTVHTV